MVAAFARWVSRRTFRQRDKPPTFNSNAAGGVAHTLWSSAPAPDADSPEIVLVRSYSVDDGRYINNGWLQEMPDPITKLTWDNAALISPDYAKHLKVESGDLLQITVTESTPRREGQAAATPARDRGVDRAGTRRQFHHDLVRLRPHPRSRRRTALRGGFVRCEPARGRRDRLQWLPAPHEHQPAFHRRRRQDR